MENPLATILEKHRTPDRPPQPTGPCPTCGSAVYWQDPAGNLHCGECQPPTVSAMVRKKFLVAKFPDGSFELHDLSLPYKERSPRTKPDPNAWITCRRTNGSVFYARPGFENMREFEDLPGPEVLDHLDKVSKNDSACARKRTECNISGHATVKGGGLRGGGSSQVELPI